LGFLVKAARLLFGIVVLGNLARAAEGWEILLVDSMRRVAWQRREGSLRPLLSGSRFDIPEAEGRGAKTAIPFGSIGGFNFEGAASVLGRESRRASDSLRRR